MHHIVILDLQQCVALDIRVAFKNERDVILSTVHFEF
jgi:hypothetical protein